MKNTIILPITFLTAAFTVVATYAEVRIVANLPAGGTPRGVLEFPLTEN